MLLSSHLTRKLNCSDWKAVTPATEKSETSEFWLLSLACLLMSPIHLDTLDHFRAHGNVNANRESMALVTREPSRCYFASQCQ